MPKAAAQMLGLVNYREKVDEAKAEYMQRLRTYRDMRAALLKTYQPHPPPPAMQGASRHDLVGWAHNHGVAEIAVPRKIVVVEDIPVLGTGKTDYVSIEKKIKSEAATAA